MNAHFKNKNFNNKQSSILENFHLQIKLIIVLCFLVVFSNNSEAQVEIYQEPLELPTYGVEKPEIMPDWKRGRYPYTMYDRLTNVKGTKTYNAVYVENEYVKALVLPEIGGRLHGATDKTNGYEFLYDQKVIKPGLVAKTGAWISGGVEWNFPTGHRPSCFRDTDWDIVENEDGSKTAWVGEFDRLTGMRWLVGTTVHPGRTWVETKVRLYNCTPYVQKGKYWATCAVRATQNYQAVIPGEVMTGHGKREFTRWPVHDGVDMSYWKNVPGSGSLFVVDSQSDFFGGYSPEENAGIVHFADHHIVRGKKFFTWGTAPAGRIWERILTDGDLPYYEPQAGAFSDTQSSLFWLKPGETKIFSHFWFPVRDIGVYDFANLEGAINLELKDNKAINGWSSTGKNPDAVVSLTYEGAEIYKKTVSTDPAKPFLDEASLPENADLYQLKMVIQAANGEQLLSFQHAKPINAPLPEPEPLPLKPEEIKSQDELYVIADRLIKYEEKEAAILYYQEVLKRDPKDIRTNTALGEFAMHSGNFKEAISHFNIALERDEDFFRAWYFKGLAQLKIGDIENAVKSFNRSSYSLSWYGAAHFELAQISLKFKKPLEALNHIEKSIQGNGDNTDSYAIKALALNQLGKYEEALNSVQTGIKDDPLNSFLRAVKCKVLKDSEASEAEIQDEYLKLYTLTRFDSENHIELAIRFARCGAYDDAIEVLDKIAENQDLLVTPLVFYYKAYYENLRGNSAQAEKDLKRASNTSSVYCFPNRIETGTVLGWALETNDEDANTHDLLALLYYSRKRSEEAISHWEKSVALNSKNAVAYRNLGLVYHEKGELLKAKRAYEAALAADPLAGKVIVELGLLNKELKRPYKEQLDLFENNIDVVAGYQQAVSQLIELYVLVGKSKDALTWLQQTHFNSWEGRYGIHQLWVQSNLNLGDVEMKDKNYKSALKYYNQSLEYPFNLEVAEQHNTIHARKYFKIAQALEALGEKQEANNYYKKVLDYQMKDGNGYQFFRGLAMESLGKKNDAQDIYRKMYASIENGNISIGEKNEDHGNAIRLYVQSLALRGLGKVSEAKKLNKKAIELYPMVEVAVFAPPRSGY